MSTYTHTDRGTLHGTFGRGSIHFAAFLTSGRLGVETCGMNPVMDFAELEDFVESVREAKAAAEAARRAEAEAADKARLDQEAEAFGRVLYPGQRFNKMDDWARMTLRDLALAARELHKDDTK